MKMSRHIGLSLAISLLLFALFRSIGMSVAAFISGVFLDIDHVFDYLREYGFRTDVRFFFLSFHKTLYRRVVLFLHAWEWLALLAVSAALVYDNSIVIGICIGIGQHLITDQCTNPVCKWGYSISYRARNGFRTPKIFPGRGLA